MSLDPQTIIAQATSAAGNAIATFMLAKKGAAAVAGLQNLAAKLPNIPIGKVAPGDAGILAGQIAQALSLTTPSDQLVIQQLGSLSALISNAAGSASTGDITITQALLQGAGQNFANGINSAVAFWQGFNSVTAPAPAPAAAS